MDGSSLGSGSLRIDATNGTPNVPFAVMASTNAALPLTQWTNVVTGIFDTNGCLNALDVPANPQGPQLYFLIREY